jgi:hypothetical protein
MRRDAGAVTAVLTIGLGALGSVAGCSSSASPAASSGIDSGATAPDDSGARTDASLDAAPGDAGVLDGASATDASADAAADAPVEGPVSVLGTILLSGTPTAMAFNPATDVLYVALADASGAGAGIAVIDGTTNTLVTTIASPGDASAPSPIVAMAVDLVSNVLYAADSTPTAQTLYTINGATSAVENSLVLGVVQSIAVDSTTHLVYALSRGTPFAPDGGANVIVPAAITIVGASSDAGPPVIVPRDIALSGSGIALDETNHRLYLCGPTPLAFSNGSSTPAAVDTLDTTQDLASIGSQTTFSGGAAVTCVAGWGGAAVVTAGASGVDFVGGPAVPLPTAFVPATAVGAGGAAAASVVVFGSDVSSGTLEVAAVGNADAGAVSLAPTAAGGGTGSWGPVALAGASGGIFRAYATSRPVDAGLASSVTYVSIRAH